MAEQCQEVYTRPAELRVPGSQNVQCTYLAGHQARHSFESLKTQDECDLERKQALVDPAGADLPTDVETLLANITDGRADPYLEAILAVTHNRKRALRGVPGFRRER